MRLRILAEAEAELLEAMRYYEQRQNGLGFDLHDCVDEVLCTIGEAPYRFPVYEGKQPRREYRRVLVKRFPYIIVYQVRDAEVLVVAIAQTSREPGYWESR
ncbi:MAG: type II toxin-antitoxin system RelE/ParE family toxin [Thermoguttaceae bacterium]